MGAKGSSTQVPYNNNLTGLQNAHQTIEAQRAVFQQAYAKAVQQIQGANIYQGVLGQQPTVLTAGLASDDISVFGPKPQKTERGTVFTLSELEQAQEFIDAHDGK